MNYSSDTHKSLSQAQPCPSRCWWLSRKDAWILTQLTTPFIPTTLTPPRYFLSCNCDLQFSYIKAMTFWFPLLIPFPLQSSYFWSPRRTDPGLFFLLSVPIQFSYPSPWIQVAGPWETHFIQHCFTITLMRKKVYCCLRPLPMWSLHVLPMYVWGFMGTQTSISRLAISPKL